MASKRLRGSKWEYVVKRAGVLDAPLYLTFADEAEGDEYCRKLEMLLDRGIVPTDHRPVSRVTSVSDLVHRYMDEKVVKEKDAAVLRTVERAVGKASLAGIDANWVDGWISDMKRVDKLAPATIRAKVGALARCADWGVRKKLLVLPDNPLRTLPEGYAGYTDDDALLAGIRKEDTERDRRLEPGEEDAIRRVLAVGVLPRKQQPLVLEHGEALTALFDLALESAMRLREMYTLTVDQVHLDKRTVFLDKTKNGDKRAVPLSTVAVHLLTGRGDAMVFPWWSPGVSLKLTSNYLSKLFASVFEVAGCGDLHFHDLRHEATSRLFERTKLLPEQIMKITGHRSHRMMMRYLNLRGSDLADKLW